MNLLPVALAALLSAPPALAVEEAAAVLPAPRPAADGGAPDAGPATVPGGLFTISGKIAAVDFAHGRFTVEGPEGPIELGVDRNTGVYLEKRMGTLRSLSAGLPVRACYAGADKKVFWVEVHLKGILPGRAGLETKAPAPGPATPPTEGDGEEGAVPPESGAARPAPPATPQPGPGRTTPGPKSGD
ncbi:MAG TPA: hypothetical protein VFE30_00595 [Anaeromyxobacteraceae bacterium]|jgi:hypothetical protein|nr:hypothetical protein [Anaeromyxobacteraceae bacterium]